MSEVLPRQHSALPTREKISERLPNAIRQNDHVLYIQNGITNNALVTTVFAENGLPSLTIVMVLRGESRGICYKTCVPHRTRHTTERGYWILPSESAHGETNR